jgi:aminoacrylate hydrolase
VVESIEQMSADLVAVMEAAGLDGAHYLGHSTGGAIGVATALDYPERIRSLLICSSTTWGDPYRHKVFAIRKRLFEQLGGVAYAQFRTLLLYPPYWINTHHEALAADEASTETNLGSAHIQGSRLDAILAFDRRAELHRINVPTLVVCADDDILTPRYFSEEYAQLIPAARTKWLLRGGHAVTMTEPELFNRVALEFFRSVATS